VQRCGAALHQLRRRDLAPLTSYDARVRRAALAIALTLAPTAARADLLDVPAGARATARAGAGLLATDDATALVFDPAGLARSTALRVVAGLAAARRTLDFTPSAIFATGAAPAVASRAGVALLPWGGVVVGLGERVVVAAAFLPPAEVTLTYPSPPAAFDPMHDDRASYPARYGGGRLHLGRWGGGVGAAVRCTDWLAAGASLLAYRVTLEHEQTLWAGQPAAGLGVGDLSPAYDMTFSASGHDAFVPAAGAGVVIAPLAVPVEIGASVLWSDTAHIAGAPALADSRGAGAATAAVAGSASASLDLPLPTLVRLGARGVLGRVAVSLEGELALLRDAQPAWSVDGVAVMPAGAEAAAVTNVPLGPALTSAWSVRGAVDVQVLRGTLTLVAGGGFTRRGATEESTTPAWPDADTITLALGAEARVAGATVTLGVSQAIRPERDVAATLPVLTPRGPGDARAVAGRYAGGTTVVALDVELELL
jgi:hypothetical protein